MKLSIKCLAETMQKASMLRKSQQQCKYQRQQTLFKTVNRKGHELTSDEDSHSSLLIAGDTPRPQRVSFPLHIRQTWQQYCHTP